MKKQSKKPRLITAAASGIFLPGINIQWPWSEKILAGKKSVETRHYPLPDKFKNVKLAIIETPGPRRRLNRFAKARVVGTVIFSDSFKYKDYRSWCDDFDRHCVPADDPQYCYRSDKGKWGWTVAEITPFDEPLPPPDRKHRGIVFASRVFVPKLTG